MSTTGEVDSELPVVRPRPHRGPSMADVAAMAKVSAQTVSRVSTGAENVKPETRARVQQVMDQLGYLPNRAARALRSGSFHTIGLVAHRFTRTGISHTVEAVVGAAREAGYAVTLVDMQPSSQGASAAFASLSEQAIDGLIVILAETTVPDDLTLPRGIPAVINDPRFPGHRANVGCDDVGGTRTAVEHLLALGHKTVHHITGPEDSVAAALRKSSWRQTLIDHGREVPAPLPGDWTPASGYEQGKILARDPSVTAVFCGNDEMAAGLYRALEEAGRRVPDDVSVIGFDDVLAPFLSPPLTTVAQDFETLGHELVQALLRQIQAGEGIPLQQMVPTRLVVRSSTAAAHHP